MLFRSKSEVGLKQAAADFGVHPKKELWKLPAMYVGEYAEGDAKLTLKLWHTLKPLLRKEELESIFELELNVLPVLIEMTLKGIRFDRDKCEQLIDRFQKREKELQKEMKKLAGRDIEVWAADSIAKAFDGLGLAYNKTAQGAPSFTKSFLDTYDHPLAKMIDMSQGNWDYNSYFYDMTHASTNTKFMLEAIDKGTKNWYIVFVDFHF